MCTPIRDWLLPPAKSTTCNKQATKTSSVKNGNLKPTAHVNPQQRSTTAQTEKFKVRFLNFELKSKIKTSKNHKIHNN